SSIRLRRLPDRRAAGMVGYVIDPESSRMNSTFGGTPFPEEGGTAGISIAAAGIDRHVESSPERNALPLRRPRGLRCRLSMSDLVLPSEAGLQDHRGTIVVAAAGGDPVPLAD